ncbi:MAG: hypothetical protein Q7J29_10140 [Stagnimonas sp.]|nr:hypothetical protein [Stagnimonas sp.]
MRNAFIVSCCGLLTACAQAPQLPERAPPPRVQVVQLIADEGHAVQQAVWRRCTDCPSTTAKTRMEPAEARPAVMAIPAAPRSVAAQPAQPLPRTELRFAFKSVSLGSAEQAALSHWAASWGPSPAAQLRITAYAEETRASRRLCEDRVRAVHHALQHLGIPFPQIEHRVEVAPDPARRVAIEVTHLPSGTAATPKTTPDFHPPEEAVARPASDGVSTARTSPEPGALP